MARDLVQAANTGASYVSKHELTHKPFAQIKITPSAPPPELTGVRAGHIGQTISIKPQNAEAPAANRLPSIDDLPDINDDDGGRDGQLRLCNGYTRAQGEQIIKSGSMDELMQLRIAISGENGRIQSQLDDEQATFKERRADLMNAGIGVSEATARAENEMDHDWIARAKAAQRAFQRWLARVNLRIQQLSQQPTAKAKEERTTSAVVISGAGRHSTFASAALNELLKKGVYIFGFTVIGDDLVVVGSEPKS